MKKRLSPHVKKVYFSVTNFTFSALQLFIELFFVSELLLVV